MVDSDSLQLGRSQVDKSPPNFSLLRHIPLQPDWACSPIGEASVDQFPSVLRQSRDKTPRLYERESVCLVQCNTRFILQLLQLPNASNIHIEAYGIGLAGESNPELSSMALGYFSPLEGCSIPILERHLFSKVAIHVQDLLANNVYFKLGLESEAGRDIDFTVALRKQGCWEDYFRESMMHRILQRIRLSRRVELSIFNYLPLQPIDHPSIHYPEPPSPSIHSPQVTVLRTDFSLAFSMIVRLADSEDVILPNLKCYSSTSRCRQRL
jgi:hypothetical protein